jgi:hypothetical protein
MLAEIVEQDYEFAYTGIDRSIIDAIQQRDFRYLIGYQGKSDRIFRVSDARWHCHFLLDRYGILRGWMNALPNQTEFIVDWRGDKQI